MIAEYITKEELQQHLVLKDEGLNEQYQQLRKANNAFYIREWEITSRVPFSWRRPFRKRKGIVTRYEVLEDLGGQARICSFPTTKGDEWRFRTLIDELDLKTFIYGFLNGAAATIKELEQHHGKPKYSVGQLVKVVDGETMERLCKEHGWAVTNDMEKYCGWQFAIYDIKYSYAQKTHTYEIGQWGHCMNWIREELIEAWEEQKEWENNT